MIQAFDTNEHCLKSPYQQRNGNLTDTNQTSSIPLFSIERQVYRDYSKVDDKSVPWLLNSAQVKGKGPRGGVTVPFPVKLFKMLKQVEKEGLDRIVSWQPHGRCFLVHRTTEFVEVILPRFFKQSKIQSFQRQLNLYGFQRLNGGPDKNAYYHELFLRGRPALPSFIIRKIGKSEEVSLHEDDRSKVVATNFYNMLPCYAEEQISIPSTESVENHSHSGALVMLNPEIDADEVTQVIEGMDTTQIRNEDSSGCIEKVVSRDTDKPDEDAQQVELQDFMPFAENEPNPVIPTSSGITSSTLNILDQARNIVQDLRNPRRFVNEKSFTPSTAWLGAVSKDPPARIFKGKVSPSSPIVCSLWTKSCSSSKKKPMDAPFMPLPLPPPLPLLTYAQPRKQQRTKAHLVQPCFQFFCEGDDIKGEEKEGLEPEFSKIDFNTGNNTGVGVFEEHFFQMMNEEELRAFETRLLES